MRFDYGELAEAVKAGYRQATWQYRRDDEIEVQSANHRRLGAMLKAVCRSFPQPIRVLDIGCGTGRFFHCLENVERLVGLDVSEEMLAAARNPVRAEAIKVRDIQLVCGNAFLTEFPAGGFHFTYSLGMFGHGCPVTPEICTRFFEWLAPGGKLFFNTVDPDGQPLIHRTRRATKARLYPLLPGRFRRILDEREQRSPFFEVTRAELTKLMLQTPFRDFTMESHRCSSPLWEGRHLECLAVKGG